VPSESQVHYSFAEWWLLAQADWLSMLYPSAYSMTAAEVGFGTAGSSRARCRGRAAVFLQLLRSMVSLAAGAMQRFDYTGSKYLRSSFAPECFGDLPLPKSEL
jgi:hypothetical protein